MNEAAHLSHGNLVVLSTCLKVTSMLQNNFNFN